MLLATAEDRFPILPSWVDKIQFTSATAQI